jgi:hypothetical protein
MRIAPVNPEIRANRRVIVASFVAGMGAMVLAGIVAPVAMSGDLGMRDAAANTLTSSVPVIEPLDVEAIEATLAAAEAEMAASRVVTDDDMLRLERLAR